MNPYIDAVLLNRLQGTLWQGLALDERPVQGRSPFPFLSLRELLALPVAR